MDESIAEKLRELNVFPNSIDESVEIFKTVQNEEDIKQEMIKRHYTCGTEQYIFFHFSALLKRQPGILQEAEQRLGDLGVPLDVVREYMQEQQHPGLLMALRHREIPFEVRENFFREANQFALNKIQEYLGIKQADSEPKKVNLIP